MEIGDRVKELITGYCDEHKIELVDVVYRREAGGMMLRIVADTETGIQLSECEQLNRFTEAKLDTENLINERYIIEVTSPGIDRPLTTDRDFRKVAGKLIEVELARPVDGKKYFRGVLEEPRPSSLVICAPKGLVEVPRDAILRARLVIGHDRDAKRAS